MLKTSVLMWNKTIYRTIGPVTAAIATTGVLYSTHDTNQRLYATNSSDSWFSNLFQNNENVDKTSATSNIIKQSMKEQEYTKTVTYPTPVSWFETNHYNANNPIEDRHCECYLKHNNAFFFGIFDGHSGWHCSESLRTRLPYYVSLALMKESDRSNVTSTSEVSSSVIDYLSNPDDDCLSFKSPEGFKDKQKRLGSGLLNFAQACSSFVKENTISEILKYTYLSLDRDIAKEAIPDGICNEPIWAGISGAVAIGVLIQNNDIYVASTGDCRSVLGVKSNNGSWYDIALSEDHTADNKDEVARITKAHPGEEMNVIKHKRLLGQLQPLRSFGDVVYKWTKELHREVLDVVYGRAIVPKTIYLTPPYLTAQPDVQHKTISKDDRFVIIASDGLWDTVSNEKAVCIIGKYLDDIKQGKKLEENGATRLLKYALGQGDEQRLYEMLRIPINHKRNYHDDITVTVVYLDPSFQSMKSKL